MTFPSGSIWMFVFRRSFRLQRAIANELRPAVRRQRGLFWIARQCGGGPLPALHLLNRMLLGTSGLGSKGQRNTFAKFLCWRKILQCLPRALVESKSNLVEVRLGMLG